MLTSIRRRLGLVSVAHREERVDRRCCRCGANFRVPAGLLQGVCPSCNAATRMGDLYIRGSHWGGSLITSGVLFVHERARVTTDVAAAGLGARIEGRFDGSLISGGLVWVCGTASIGGSIRAPAMRVEPGAIIEGGPIVVPDDPLGRVDVSRPPWRLSVPEPGVHPMVCPMPERYS